MRLYMNLHNSLSNLSLSQPSLHWLRSDDDIHFHSERHGEDGLLKEDHKKAWGSHSKALQVRAESPKMTFLTLLTTYQSVQPKSFCHIGEIKRSQVHWEFNDATTIWDSKRAKLAMLFGWRDGILSLPVNQTDTNPLMASVCRSGWMALLSKCITLTYKSWLVHGNWQRARLGGKWALKIIVSLYLLSN